MKPFRTHFVTLALMFVVWSLLIHSAAIAATPPEATFLSRITQGLKTPVRLAIDPFDNIIVADPRGGGILKFNNLGQLLTRFPVKSPRSVAIAPSGDLLVSQGNFVAVLDGTTGSEKAKLGKGIAQFKQASGIAVATGGQIYVVDSLDNCVQVFKPDGSPLPLTTASPGKPSNSFGTGGSQSGQFSLPTGISFEKLSGQVAVADTLNGRVQFFSSDGTFRRTVGSHGSGPLLFTSPRGVAFEYTKDAPPLLGRMYVVDSFQSEVQVIDPAGNGTYLGSIGGYGLQPGKLISPADIAFDQTTNRLLVANGLGDLSLFGINVTAPITPDITPPVLTLNPLPATTSSGSVTLSGTVESEATVSVIINPTATAGPIVTTPQSPASSFWTATISGLTNNGIYTISVIATDRSANSTVITASIISNLSAVKVAINPVTSPTNSSSQLLSGTMDSGATVTLGASTGATFGAVSYPSPTTWQATVSNLASGDNAITATAANLTTSASATAIVTLVPTPPDLNVSALVDGSTTSSPLLTVSGQVQTGSYFDRLTVNGQNVPVNNEFFSTVIPLTAADTVITVQAFDRAGNVATDVRTIHYAPERPTITIDTPPDGSTVSASTVMLSGTAPPSGTVSLQLYNGSANGIQFLQLNQPGTGSAWSTSQPIPLDPGLNTIVATVTMTNGATAQTKVTVNSSAAVPTLAISSPPRDRAVNTAGQSVSGTAAPGATVVATVNGAPVPLTTGSNGSFTLTVPIAAEGPYQVTITATDPLGNAVSTSRAIIFDASPPALVVNSETPLRVTASEGIFSASDKNGPLAGAVITRNADGSTTIDLSTASYDAATLDIHALDGAGNSTRNGDYNGDGTVDIIDAISTLRAAIGLSTATVANRLRADVTPLANGVPTPDGVMNIFDAVYILEKIVGLH